jgi:phage portal protein BeeE
MRMISVGMGVDPALLGDNANKTYSNYVEAVKALIKLTSLPLLDWILDWINAWYMPQYGTPKMSLGYDESDIKALQEDANDKVKRLVSMIQAPLISPDEGREALGRKALGGMAAELLAKVGTIPLNDIGVGTVPLSDEDEAAAAALEEEIKQLLDLPMPTNGKH